MDGRDPSNQETEVRPVMQRWSWLAVLAAGFSSMLAVGQAQEGGARPESPAPTPAASSARDLHVLWKQETGG
jgi:hypothetical protein